MAEGSAFGDSSEGKFPGRNSREFHPETRSPARALYLRAKDDEGYFQYNRKYHESYIGEMAPSTVRRLSKVIPSRTQRESLTAAWSWKSPQNNISVNDPAYWWVKASNLGELSDQVVQFYLGHVVLFDFPTIDEGIILLNLSLIMDSCRCLM